MTKRHFREGGNDNTDKVLQPSDLGNNNSMALGWIHTKISTALLLPTWDDREVLQGGGNNNTAKVFWPSELSLKHIDERIWWSY